jgi:DNA-binding MarR family transcriptional regulator
MAARRAGGAAALKDGAPRASNEAVRLKPEPPRPAPAKLSPQRLDRVIHDRTRLAIVTALAANDTLSFTDLRAITATTDGNLSVHARRLEDTGYVQCEKTFADRTPRTEFRLTAAGRRAFEKYLDHMDALIKAARKR